MQREDRTWSTDTQVEMPARPNFRSGAVRRFYANWLTPFALNTLWLLTSLMPLDMASRLGGRILRILGRRSRKHAKIKQNLTVLLPESDEQTLERLAGEIWSNFGSVLAEFPRLGEICADSDAPRLTINVEGGLDSLKPFDRPKIFVGAHIGNWELAAASITKTGIPLSVVYNPHKNLRVATMVQEKRQSLGCGFVKKTQGMRPLVRALTEGQSLGLLVDRRIDQGQPLPFAGKDASFTTGPARLALKYDVDIIPIRVKRLEDANFVVTMESPLKLDGTEADEAEKVSKLTSLINARIEEWVRAEPHNWLCTNLIWP